MRHLRLEYAKRHSSTQFTHKVSLTEMSRKTPCLGKTIHIYRLRANTNYSVGFVCDFSFVTVEHDHRVLQ